MSVHNSVCALCKRKMTCEVLLSTSPLLCATHSSCHLNLRGRSLSFNHHVLVRLMFSSSPSPSKSERSLQSPSLLPSASLLLRCLETPHHQQTVFGHFVTHVPLSSCSFECEIPLCPFATVKPMVVWVSSLRRCGRGIVFWLCPHLGHLEPKSTMLLATTPYAS